MLDNLGIHSRIGQGCLSEIRIHQPLQIVQMACHSLDARILFLKLFMQQKYFLQKRPCRHNRINRELQFPEQVGIGLGNQRTNLDPRTRFLHRSTTEFDSDLRLHIIDTRINTPIRQKNQCRICIRILRRDNAQLKIQSSVSRQQCPHFCHEFLPDIGPRKFSDPIPLRLVVPGNSPERLVNRNINVLREAFYDMPTLAQRCPTLKGDEIPARRFEQSLQRHCHPPVLLDSLRRKPESLARLRNKHPFLALGKRPKITLHKTT